MAIKKIAKWSAELILFCIISIMVLGILPPRGLNSQVINVEQMEDTIINIDALPLDIHKNKETIDSLQQVLKSNIKTLEKTVSQTKQAQQKNTQKLIILDKKMREWLETAYILVEHSDTFKTHKKWYQFRTPKPIIITKTDTIWLRNYLQD